MEFDAEPKMVGRDEELEELKSHLDRAAEGRGSTVFISGEAGIGKTRLVQELRRVAQAQGFDLLFGYSLHESLTPYMPFLDALRSGDLEPLFAEEAPKVEAVYLVTHGGLLIKEVLREETELDPVLFASMLTAVGNFVIESMSKLSGEEREGTLSGLSISGYQILIEAGKTANLVAVITGEKNEFLIEDMRGILSDVHGAYGKTLEKWDGDEKSVEGIEGLLERLITSGKFDGIYYGKGDPKARRNLLFENVSLGLARHTATMPTLLCIEDLQWADPSSLALMHYVARNAGKCGLLMLGTYRPEDVAAEDGKGHPLTDTMHLMDREDLHRQLELDRLPADKIADFMHGTLGETDFDEAFLVRMHEETEGNPLFVIQLVKLLVEENIIARENGTWRLFKALEEIDIPSKTYNVILRRLNRIEEEPRKVLDYAAVIGDLFISDTLANALDMKRILLLEHLRVLEQTHRMIHPHDGGYRFDHAKIREALYGEIPQELREEYHAVIAQSIERLNKDDLDSVVEDLAFHYYHCKNKVKALHYLTQAAKKAKKEYSNEEAIRFYFEALEFEEDKKKRMEMYEALGEIHSLIGSYDKSVATYANALELAEGRGEKARIKSSMAHAHLQIGEYDESMRLCDEALGLVRGEECEEEATALEHLGATHHQRGEYDEALGCHRRALEIRGRIGDEGGVGSSLHSIGRTHFYKDEYDKALGCHRRALEIRGRIGDEGGVGSSLTNIGVTHYCKGEYDKALEYLTRGLEIEEKIGDQHGAAACLNNLGGVAYRLGEYDRALESFERALKISEKIGSQDYIANHLVNIGEVHFYRGEYDKALGYRKRALEIYERIGNQDGAALCLSNTGLVLMEKGEFDEALEHFEESLEICEKIGARRTATYNHCGIGEVHLRREDFQMALDSCNRGLDLSKEIDYPQNIANANKLLGMIYRELGSWRESIRSLEESIRLFEEHGMGGEAGDSYYEFGLMWKKKGDNEEARVDLKKALKILTRLGLEFKAGEVNAALESLDG